MIRVDRNLQESVNILPDSHLSWQPNDNDFIQHIDNKDLHQLRPPTPAEALRDRSSSLSPAPDTNSPQTQPEAPSSPRLPLVSEEREEQVKEPQREEEEEEETRVDRASRLSTPLSELSPPPDDLDVIVDPIAPAGPQSAADGPKTNVEERKTGSQVSDGGAETTLGKTSDDSTHPSPAADALSALSNPSTITTSQSSTTNPASNDGSASKSGDFKVISILRLNNELLNVCMEFQKRGIPPSDALYHQYSQRLQSNLAWLAAAADQSRPVPNVSLPMVDAPPPVDFYSCERIQQLYGEMPGFFAKEFARRQQLGIPLTIPGNGVVQVMNPAQKRERTEDGLPDPANKRQNIGDAKSQMMPPPSSLPNINPSSVPTSNTTIPPAAITQPSGAQFSLPISNGPTPPTSASQQFHQQSSDTMASARARQAQLRAVQQQHQQAAANAKQMPASMPGPSNTSSQGIGQPMGVNASGVSGTGPMPHGAGNVNANAGQHSITAQQAVQILQNPNHPIMQYLMRAIPGFQGLPQHTQMQKIAMAAIQMQSRNQQADQQRAAGAGIPNAQQMQGVSQYSSGGMQGSNQGGFGGAGSISGINLNNLSPQQRHLLMMHQQQRAGANMGMGNIGAGASAASNGSSGPGMMMNPQQISLSPQHLQQQQQQRMGGGMSVNMGSPMIGGTNEFPSNLRSNNTIPGIARSTRSPIESTSSPMTPRGSRGASMGPDDYQRMMMKQHQQGQSPQATMFGSPGNAAQGIMGVNWVGQQGGGMGMGQSQNQNPQFQGIQMQGGYGMSSPTQAQQQPQQHQQAQSGVAGLGAFMGGVSASPPPMGVSSPTWAGSPTQQQGANGGSMGGMFSPFTPTGGSLGDISRHASATPGPQQSQTPSLTGSQDDYSGFFDWPS